MTEYVRKTHITMTVPIKLTAEDRIVMAKRNLVTRQELEKWAVSLVQAALAEYRNQDAKEKGTV